jgi:guanosine-3',5'-bis(diphosphate) 3'-pyrophosphohydrolase
MSSNLAIITKTADFAAKKHSEQRRKDKEETPYINHPIGVAHLATSVGETEDLVILQACLLHDTVEDTDTTHEELVREFGEEVANVVKEVRVILKVLYYLNFANLISLFKKR